MPAFSHCFLKRFIAFSNDSPSLTRTPGILRITSGPKGPRSTRRTRAKAGQYMRREGAVKPTLSRSTERLQPPPAGLTLAIAHDRSAALGDAAGIRDGARREPAHGDALRGPARRAAPRPLHPA